MKAFYSLMVVILLVGCKGTRQKAIQTICKEVGKNSSNCTKTMGLISASVVENQLINHSNPATRTKFFRKFIRCSRFI